MKILGFILMLFSGIGMVLSYVGFTLWWLVGLACGIWAGVTGSGILGILGWMIGGAAGALVGGFVGLGLCALIGVIGYAAAD